MPRSNQAQDIQNLIPILGLGILAFVLIERRTLAIENVGNLEITITGIPPDADLIQGVLAVVDPQGREVGVADIEIPTGGQASITLLFDNLDAPENYAIQAGIFDTDLEVTRIGTIFTPFMFHVEPDEIAQYTYDASGDITA
jgi:hypothetical protein